MRRLKADLILWRILSFCYCVLIFLSILPIAVLLQALLDGYPIFEKSRIATTVSLIGFAVISACITLSLRAALIRKSSRNTFKSPCKIALNVHNEEDFIALLKKGRKVRRIAENSWYGKERGSRDLRVFVFSTPERSQYSNLSFADSCVKMVNEKTKFPSLIDTDMHQHMGRVQLFLYDEIPQTVLNSAARSVEDNVEQSEFLVNLFVDLKKGMLYIPFCRSRLLGAGRLYQYAIKRVEKWLNL